MDLFLSRSNFQQVAYSGVVKKLELFIYSYLIRVAYKLKRVYSLIDSSGSSVGGPFHDLNLVESCLAGKTVLITTNAICQTKLYVFP